MSNTRSLTVLLLAVTSLMLSGCPTSPEQPMNNPSLKPNVSQPAETAASEQQTAKVPDANAAETDPPIVPTPPAEPKGSGTTSLQPAQAEASDPAVVPLADAIPKYETPIWEPSVVMSEAHQQTCLVIVGDKFPPLDAHSLAGDAVNTEKLLDDAFAAGKRMAVIVFWKSDNLYGRDQFTRLEEEIVVPFEKAGVEVIAIHVGGAADDVEQVEPDPGDAVKSLLDPAGSALAKVATGKLPRTYLLDSAGTVLWHDLEYSSGTRRDLRNAMLYHLTQQAEAAE